jgi:hypothetical protein
MDDKETLINALQQENKELKEKNAELEDKLKKYTNNSSHRKYYESNKEKIQNIQKQYLDKLKNESPEEYKEKKKEANRRYYEKKKNENRQNITKINENCII